MTMLRRAWWIGLVVSGVLGCEKPSTPPTRSSAPAEVCTKVGEQCKLPDGPLGVCNSVPCKDGEAGPCFRCVSQH